MTTGELARVCAQEIVQRVASQPSAGQPGYRPPEDIAADLILGAISRALEEAGVPRVVSVETGHVSVDVGTTAKGDLTYSAKIVLPFTGHDDADVTDARQRAQAELEKAETFLRTRYGRATS